MLQCQDNCFKKFMTTQQTSMEHTNIHIAYPLYITWYQQTFIWHTKAFYIELTNIHFAHQSISHVTHETFTLHTKVYHQDRVEFVVYTTQASSNICHSCIIFQIVCPVGNFVVCDSRAASTVSCFCYRQTESDLPSVALQDAHLGSVLGQSSLV